MGLRLSIASIFASIVFAQLAWADQLEIPGHGSTQSGVGVISGWKCRANGRITVRFDGGASIPLVYGSERTDTRGACGDADNGFVAIFNWGRLDDGTYSIVAYDNGREFDRATFTVVTPGVEFLTGVTGSGTATLSNGQRATLEWSQASQSFVATDYTDPRGRPDPPDPPTGTNEEQQFQALIGTWNFTINFSSGGEPLTRPYVISRVQQGTEGIIAVGTDPFDDSTFVIIPTIGELADEYDFFMRDIDTFSTEDPACSFYIFNQSGNSISGIFFWSEVERTDPSSCDTSRIFSTGDLTGRRR